MTARDWLAHILIIPLTTFELACVVLFFAGLVDFLDGLAYWREFRQVDAQAAASPTRARVKQGAGCLAVIAGIFVLAWIVWR